MKSLHLIALLATISLTSAAPGGPVDPVDPVGHAPVPGQTWMRYADPAEAGWSAEGLAAAREYWESIQSAAWMVVEDGVVVVAWGDVERRYMCHSVRKSFMSGLYGLHVDAGTIDTEKTLAELGIDDEPALTDVEKRARIEDLLRSRSGVYKLAAYEPPQNPKPERGAYEPGEFWCYNNFDFNTLCTIFEQETGRRVFEEFGARFAEPLGMQDWRVSDGYYHYERDKSIHPAYPFRMSARDCARYGLLFLRDGDWKGERILSEEWVRRSTASYSDTGEPGGGYGYMWWLFDDPETPGLKGYTARGVGGQTIAVLPDAGLVIVNRTDTYVRNGVDTPERMRLMALVLAARGDVAEDAPEPELVPLEDASRPLEPLDEDPLARLAGRYALLDEQVELRARDGVPVVDIPTAGVFALQPVAEVPDALVSDVFWIEDIELHVAVTEPARGGRGSLVSEYGLLQEFMERSGNEDVEGAQRTAERALELFPMSATAHVMLGRAFLRAGERELASELAGAALDLDAGNEAARRLAREAAE